MEIQAYAAMSIQAMTLQGAHAAVENARQAQPPASAPAAAHADVILELSAAAQQLTGAS
jgi:hypothetical protein